MRERQRQLQETRGRLKEMGMGFGPQETDTMAAARSDDEEAATEKSEVVEETDTMAARGNDRRSRQMMRRRHQAQLQQKHLAWSEAWWMEDGGSKAENDEASRDVKWRIKRNNRRIGTAHVGTRGRRERVSRGAELENPVGRREKTG